MRVRVCIAFEDKTGRKEVGDEIDIDVSEKQLAKLVAVGLLTQEGITESSTVREEEPPKRRRSKAAAQEDDANTDDG